MTLVLLILLLLLLLLLAMSQKQPLVMVLAVALLPALPVVTFAPGLILWVLPVQVLEAIVAVTVTVRMTVRQ